MHSHYDFLNRPPSPVQYPALPENLFCEEDEIMLDYDVETLKNFNLFSSMFSLEELMHEIPIEMPPPHSKRGVREDCMWAEGKLEEKLDIDVNNNNTNCPQLKLVSPNSIISIKKDYFMRHLVTSPLHFNGNEDGCYDNNNNDLSSPTSSTIESSDDGCSQLFRQHIDEHKLLTNSNESDIEIDVVGDGNTTTTTTCCPRSSTPETPTFKGTFDMTQRSSVQRVLIKRSSDDPSSKTKERSEKPQRSKRSRTKCQRYRENIEQPYESSSEETSTGSSSDRSKSHNTLERKRRINLKHKFEDLRQVVPSLMPTDKAAKVLILTEAIREIQKLKARETSMTMEEQGLLIVKESLHNKLEELKKSFFVTFQH